MAQEFPLLEIEGSAGECGEQHGVGAADRVARSIEIYLAAFGRQTTLTLADVRERARGFAQQIEQIDPDILAELKGIAAGSKQLFEDIVAINCRTELLYGDKAGTRPATECTTVVALPEATAERRILIGKNWDWRDACVDSVVILKVAQRGKPRLSLMVEAGMVGRDGFNEHGIAVIGNLLVSHHDKGRTGVPIPILRRRILHSTTYCEAIETLVRSPRGASGNYLIAHRDGVAIDFEVTPDEVFVVYPERGLLTHSNHFQSPVAQATGAAKFYSGDSLYRDFRARQLLEPKIGAITRADIEATLKDHFGLPRSICRHPHTYPYGEPTMTIASVQFDLQRETMYVAAGQPCESTYRAVGLPQARKG
ncbi:MAG: C45 family autoproteolytic acyltransferase/hydrolase [Proteobacteria bacterium]|nr:C45 family autoproteolytic acyltransferase/hydrolase [Pseudomonadota bacterium]